MSIRLAIIALAVSLWSCADDSDPLAPEDAVLRPTGELQPYDLSPIVSLDEVRSMPRGTPVFLRTEFAHGELADLEMTFVQVVDDFLAAMPVYMVEAADPVLIQLGGVAQGMSGSPIFSEQGTWGAVAYGFDSQDSPPYYFFVTPIEWVIGARGALPAAKRTGTWAGSRIVPLETPVLSSGLNGVHPLPEGRSSFLSGASAAGLTQERQESFAAGRSLAVGLLLGEVVLGSLGSISYVDGERIYGFGHPMFGSGPVALPIIEAKVLGAVSNLFAPYKFATLNPTVRGTVTEDRLPAVRGILDAEPELVPVKSVYAFPAGSELELTHRAAVGLDPFTSLDLVATAFFRPLTNRVDNDPDHSIRVATDISFVGTDSTLTRSRLYAAPDGRLLDAIFSAYNDVSFALSELMTRDDYAMQIREAEARVELIPENRFAVVAEVAADTVVSLGSTLDITASLRVGRTSDRAVELALSVPDTLPAGFYQLEVGSAATLGEDISWGTEPVRFPFGGEETLAAVFARLNKPDENVRLKARLTFVSPPIPPEGEDVELPEFPPFDPFLPPAPFSTQEDVGLWLQGVQIRDIEVVF